MVITQIKATVTLIILFLGVNIVAKTVGSLLSNVDHPNLRGFTEGCKDKPQPCWYGIVPGQMTIEEALSIMEKMGYPVEVAEKWDNNFIFRRIVNQNMTVAINYVYNPYTESEMVMEISLFDLGSLQLIDVLDHFGAPTYIELYRLGDFLKYPPYMIITLDGRYTSRLSQNFSGIELSTQYPPFQGIEWQARLRRKDYCAIELERGGLPC